MDRLSEKEMPALRYRSRGHFHLRLKDALVVFHRDGRHAGRVVLAEFCNGAGNP